MKKIIEYKIVNNLINDADPYETFEERLNRFISEGWQPYGELQVEKVMGFPKYMQPMVKYEEEPKIENTWKGKPVSQLSEEEKKEMKDQLFLG